MEYLPSVMLRLLLCSVFALLCAGCGTAHSSRAAQQQNIALATLSDADAHGRSEVRLGAGDGLGRSLFHHYADTRHARGDVRLLARARR